MRAKPIKNGSGFNHNGGGDMKVKAEKNINLSGNAKPAGKAKMKEAINKAYVCQFFKVKPNTPSHILKKDGIQLVSDNSKPSPQNTLKRSDMTIEEKLDYQSVHGEEKLLSLPA